MQKDYFKRFKRIGIMDKVIKIEVNTINGYDKAIPKNAKKIYFVRMDEGGGNYEISDMGHIRSSIGNSKILKYQNDSKNTRRVNLRDEKKAQNHYNVKKLMEKYHPNTVTEWIKQNIDG